VTGILNFGKVPVNGGFRMDGDYHVEDPFVWHDGTHFNMLAKDISGTITGEANSGVSLVSDDGISWDVADIPQGYSKQVSFEDGRCCLLGCLERPQLLLDDSGQPKCFFAAAADGPGHFRKALNTWTIAIPVSN
jgi:predicted heme/steroid binding protein